MKDKLKIGIIGLGYVGLPLLYEFSKKFDVKGFDISKKKIQLIKNRKDYTNQFSKTEFKKIKTKNISNDKKILKNCNFFIVTVPTPVTKKKTPNLSAVIAATKIVGQYIKKNNYVVYESTFYPGVTEEICIKIIEKISKLKAVNIDKNIKNGFHYGYSPERINPGDKKHSIKDIVKVVSGGTDKSAIFIEKVYKTICLNGTYKAESVKVAEAAKVIENTQRDINIALINEFSQIFSKMNINTYDVLEAAKTKWNFLNFTPGLVGGHCIGVDPYYLTYKAKKVGYKSKLTLAGRELNDNMHLFILKKFLMHMKKNFNKKKYRILLLGISFKENINDYRNSRSISLAQEIKRRGHNLDIFDKNISKHNFLREYNLNLIEKPKKNYYDGIIISVGHDDFKSLSRKYFYSLLKSQNKGIIFDFKNIFRNKEFITF
ncbi:MAG: hypothetical protein CBD97_02465 [Pelagibacteraceae bacterium TMED237]|nr:MAG: hypothetical protein CBD97_02465 [Pelagibacteraceae bacterium TMED237]|tara:strand:- start:5533 stop:6825 length:1293 start_codon:yes stop_codon:yes gene_type:complete